MKFFKKTNKLFYDKFVNKIAFNTPVALLFRSRNDILGLLDIFKNYRHRIENTKSGSIEVGKSWRPVKLKLKQLDFIEQVVHLLLEESDFGIRVENSRLCIYSNNDNLIDRISNLLDEEPHEIVMPQDNFVREYLLKNPYKIISKSYEFKFKVTYNPLKESTENFKQWSENIPKIKVLKIHPSLEGYFYVADSKVLGLCRLFLGNKIRRVDEMITLDEISQ